MQVKKKIMADFNLAVMKADCQTAKFRAVDCEHFTLKIPQYYFFKNLTQK